MPPSEFSEIRQQAGFTLTEVTELANRPFETILRWEHGKTKANQDILNILQRSADHVAQAADAPKPKFRFIDLFAGIGGIRRGFEAIGGKCVFTSEWNPYARQTYAANFACDHPFPGDITQVKVDDVPKHDVLVGGFPCQPFSIAGVSKKNALGRPHGFADATQGTLFFDVARIIDHHKPAAFMLENVKNLESHDKGRTFQIIMQTLSDLGYSVDWRIINGKGFVPQNRERIFIVGFRNQTDFDFSSLKIPDTKNGPVMESILHPQDGSEAAEPPFTTGALATVNPKYTLSQKLWDYLQTYAAKHKQRGNGFGYGLVGPNDKARTLSARYFKDGSEILVAQPNNRPRRLTPRECARLMGFDQPLMGFDQPLIRSNQNKRTPIIIPVSDTQAYKQFGNAVVVPVIEAVAGHMLPHIKKIPNKTLGV